MCDVPCIMLCVLYGAYGQTVCMVCLVSRCLRRFLHTVLSEVPGVILCVKCLCEVSGVILCVKCLCEVPGVILCVKCLV